MNSITIIGEVSTSPTYFCTVKGQDLLRIQLSTLDRRGSVHIHHCLAYGPAAIDLHIHLGPGERLMVRGELLYRRSSKSSSGKRMPYILIRQYNYLGGGVKATNTHPAPQPAYAAS